MKLSWASSLLHLQECLLIPTGHYLPVLTSFLVFFLRFILLRGRHFDSPCNVFTFLLGFPLYSLPLFLYHQVPSSHCIWTILSLQHSLFNIRVPRFVDSLANCLKLHNWMSLIASHMPFNIIFNCMPTTNMDV